MLNARDLEKCLERVGFNPWFVGGVLNDERTVQALGVDKFQSLVCWRGVKQRILAQFHSSKFQSLVCWRGVKCVNSEEVGLGKSFNPWFVGGVLKDAWLIRQITIG